MEKPALQQVTGTLCADDHKGHSCNQTVNDDKLIVEAVAIPIQDGREIAKAQNGLGVGDEGDPSYTLDQTGAQAVAIQGNLIGRDVGGPQGVGASTDGAMYTLTKADIHAVAVNVSNGEPRVSDVCGTLDSARGGRGSNQQRFIMEPFRKSHRAASATDDESWVRAETANTLNRFDTGERDTHAIDHMLRAEGHDASEDGMGPLQRCNTPAVAHGFYSTSGTHCVNMEPEVSPAVKVGSGGGGKVAVAHTLRAEGHDASEDGTGRGVPLTVAFHPTQDPISSIDGTTHAMGCGSRQGTATVAVATQMVVRRLTPVECERLQGFPDDYTNIPWRGKPEAPDGPRYKALGNSMAVNCMRWIGRRIDAVEKGTELPP